MGLSAWVGILQDAIIQGILWGIMVLGVYMTYRVLNYADLTVDGSFNIGRGHIGCIYCRRC